ncbi:hypothetical protein FGSG_04341 [Fusarium graminearum PH-1]|uniref:Chromosome 2, complete genome n=1 Tax=Gibberella zeae (strain ATCC MYA-4620 / CBS 123657 / FGSC 9075 / NRRL 31084 / PH-1) TaxID=229533 RepID=I1RKD9_GIBZE|nr:hypothetical protein FGSG_04341 [Fusarium graminearum PH-1]EYB24866.1 hypothetical protein FG05_04341 [Fusarium graminearum]ESU08771.1 hypothetical protein FGSG_04341 [Fusarium graminearum PH-1]CAF3515263.1 unnamed protein product [Fusarium graminearum]CAF3650296.1 unnamed protein product [Fusarium graminearum]CEF79329.1 unnamed protein product [Fusarium graminearum]|eukprot:XP_011321270.1 hypothetical protein FGSG_04341 [Fusarium graminearum PH-1]
MAFYFQPPIFGNYLVPAAPTGIPSILVSFHQTAYTPLYWQPAPVIVSTPQYILTSNIRIKIIFHRAGTVLASNDAFYNYTPTRETVLANLSWWSKQHNLGDRVYSGQCTLYTTRSQYSKLEIVPESGPITPADNVRKVSFADQIAPNEFQSIISQIATNSYGAFILVDRAYVPLQVLAQGNTQSAPTGQASSDVTNNNSKDLTDATQTTPPSTRQPSPTPSSSHKGPVDSNDKQPDKTGDGNDDDKKTPEPANTTPGSPKRDLDEKNDANVDDTEPEQSATHE